MTGILPTNDIEVVGGVITLLMAVPGVLPTKDADPVPGTNTVPATTTLGTDPTMTAPPVGVMTSPSEDSGAYPNMSICPVGTNIEIARLGATPVKFNWPVMGLIP
jgi:hypothetical protein